jgi:predicted DsbA family dithiol-disulfide isomerase
MRGPTIAMLALLLAGIGSYALWFTRTTGFEFRETAGPTGFRGIEAGEASAAFDPFAGIGASGPETASPAPVFTELCVALFGGIPEEGFVPIAVFSDYRCPWCRTLSEMLIDMDGDGVAVSWHEWPVFGPTSEIAARAALAAGMQGAYLPFHERLMNGAFAPTPAYLAALSEDEGLDPARLLIDMDGPEVASQLNLSRALAEEFRFRGTPGLIVGHTVVNGAIPERALRDLVEIERAAGLPRVCRETGGA